MSLAPEVELVLKPNLCHPVVQVYPNMFKAHSVSNYNN